MSDSEVLLWTRDTKHVTFINSICDLSVINLLLLLFNWFIEPNSNFIFLFYPVDLTYFLLNLIHWIMNMTEVVIQSVATEGFFLYWVQL